MKPLDPMKLYFYQSDVDEFKQHQDELCDWISKGDITFAYTVFRTVLAARGRAGEDGRRIAWRRPWISPSTSRW